MEELTRMLNHSTKERDSKLKIAALVTSYNDQESTQKCLEALLKQTEPLTLIIIVDNSPNDDLSRDFLEWTLPNNSQVSVLWRPENVGVAGAINIAFDFALKRNCTHLWTFDQDSEPAVDALEVLVEAMASDKFRNHQGLFASLPYDEGQRRFLYGYRFNQFKFEEIYSPPTDSTYLCDGTITAGMMIPLNKTAQSFIPESRLFIDGVDHYICVKNMQAGWKVVVVGRSRLAHQMGLPCVARIPFTNKEIIVHNYTPFRKFYIARNHSYLETRTNGGPTILLKACFWRFRIAFHMMRETVAEQKGHIWAASWAIALGTVLGIFGWLVDYRKLPAIIRKCF